MSPWRRLVFSPKNTKKRSAARLRPATRVDHRSDPRLPSRNKVTALRQGREKRNEECKERGWIGEGKDWLSPKDALGPPLQVVEHFDAKLFSKSLVKHFRNRTI